MIVVVVVVIVVVKPTHTLLFNTYSGTSNKTPFWLAETIILNLETIRKREIFNTEVRQADFQRCLCFLRVTNKTLPLMLLRKILWTRYCIADNTTQIFGRFNMLFVHFSHILESNVKSNLLLRNLQIYEKLADDIVTSEKMMKKADTIRDLFHRFKSRGNVKVMKQGKRTTIIKYGLVKDQMPLTLRLDHGTYGGSRASWPRFTVR